MARFGRFGQCSREGSWLVAEKTFYRLRASVIVDVTRARALLDAGMKSPKDIVGFGVKRVQKAIKRLNTVKNSACHGRQIFRMCRNLSPKKRKRQEKRQSRECES